MPRHKQEGEPARTTPAASGLALFRAHYEETLRFTDELRDSRCRRTRNFHERIGATVAAFRPVMGPWKAEALFYVSMHGPQRFNALKRGLGGPSSRVLTDKLRELEADGLVARENAEGVTRYVLTAHGERVARLLHPLLFYLHNAGAVDA